MRQRTWRAGVGLAAGASWLAGLIAVTPLVGSFPLTPVVRWIIRSSPGPVATFAIETFGKSAQLLIVVGVAAGAAAAIAAISVGWPRLRRRLSLSRESARRTVRRSGLVALAIVGAVLATGTGAGLLGVVATAAAAVPPALVLAATDRMDPGAGTDLARRGALSRAGLAAGAVVGLGAGASAADSLGGGASAGDASGAGQPLNVSGDGSGSDPVQEKRDTGRTVTSTASTTAASSGSGSSDGTPTATTTTAATEAGGSDGEDDPFGFDFGSMPARVGSIEDHYVVDINTSDPEVNTDVWSLSVTGHVDSRVDLNHQMLLNRDDLVSRPVTMVCISNPVGGQLIDTTTWQGIPLAALLEEAGVRDGAVDVVTHAVDGYSEAIPVDVAREERVFVAIGADGMTLTPSHGFPARLLIPGRYGMKSTKWIEEIEVVTEDHPAYWESRGWDEEAVVNTLSYIRSVDRAGTQSAVGGVAYAGTRGIQRVEVSVDGGDTWSDADLEEPAGPYTWRRWRHVFERDITQSYEVVVRATDGEGTLQTDERTGPHPGGSTGWHRKEI